MTTTGSGLPSGLSGSFGYAAEGTVGTFTAPTRWGRFIDESMELKKAVAQSKAIHGSLFPEAARRVVVGYEAGGGVKLEVQDQQLGLLLKQMLGSTPTVTEISTTGVYTQIHQVGSNVGDSISVQIGKPGNGGTIQAFSYNGTKVTDWELSVARGGIAQLSLTLDAWNEVITANFVAPSYLTPSPNVLHFASGSTYIGGTASTSDGLVSVSGNSQLAYVTGFTLKGSNKMAVDRQFQGSLYKSEQLPNDMWDYGGTVDIEFDSAATAYNAFQADTTVAFVWTLLGPVVGSSGSNHSELIATIPAAKLEGESPKVAGLDVLKMSVPFTILDDTVNPQIQLTYQGIDAAI